MRLRFSLHAQGNLQQHLPAINNELLSQEELHHHHTPSDNSQLAAPPTHTVSLEGGRGGFTKTNPRRRSEHEWDVQMWFGGVKHVLVPALKAGCSASPSPQGCRHWEHRGTDRWELRSFSGRAKQVIIKTQWRDEFLDASQSSCTAITTFCQVQTC